MLRSSFFRRLALAATATLAVATTSPALALDPALDAAQHGHRSWRDVEGFGLGTISAIAQTPDGYMWLATPKGLLRFDGVRSVPLLPPPGRSFEGNVRALLGARDGTLWVATSDGLVGFRDGAFTVPSHTIGSAVNAIHEDADGTIWTAGSVGGSALLCAFRTPHSECKGQDGGLGPLLVGLHRGTTGAMWLLGPERLWRWAEGRDEMDSWKLPMGANGLRTTAEMADRSLIVGIRRSVVRVTGDELGTLDLPEWARNLTFVKALRDKDGSLWLGTADYGLLHLHEGRWDTFSTADGLSGDNILDLFEDREGNVWVSTSRGLDQFRAVAAASQSDREGPKGRSRSVLSARDGSLWTATTTGVYQQPPGSPDVWKLRRPLLSGVSSLFEDRAGRIWAPSNVGVQYFDGERFVDPEGIPDGPIDAIAEDAIGDLWFAHRELGLLRVRPDAKATFTSKAIVRPSARVSTLAFDPTSGAVWVGLWSGGLESVKDGRIASSLSLPSESPQNARVNHIRIEQDGTLWVSSYSGLHRVANGQVDRLGVEGGLPCDRLLWSTVVENSLWVAAQCGLIRIDRTELGTWTQAMHSKSPKKIRVQLLDHWDGVGQAIVESTIGYLVTSYNFTPKLTHSPDGRLWVVTGDSLVTVNPNRLPSNNLAPPVQIEEMVSDGKTYPTRAGMRLPPLPNDLAIAYTGLSFVLPERIRFRYKLEGRDADWQDAENRRQAFYSDLAPGQYRFRVTAANASGTWNREGASLEFSVAPAWWQTGSFRAACVAAFALLIYALHRLRLAQLSRRFDASLETRIKERMSIARELHDTLLQTFQGHVLRLQTALQLWPREDGRRILEEGIDQAAAAITEGRDAVQGLRTDASEGSDLATTMQALGRSLATDPERSAIRFGVEVHGRPRGLHPVVRDDIVRIAGEALRNAFRHAAASRVEVEIRFGEEELRLRVVDDGKGMDHGVIQRGRKGHFGLQGMRERTKLIGGKLTLWSRRDSGTEVELIVPGSRAYAAVLEGAAAVNSRLH